MYTNSTYKKEYKKDKRINKIHKKYNFFYKIVQKETKQKGENGIQKESKNLLKRTNNKRLKKETKIPNTKIIQKVNKPAGVIFINTEE